MPKGDGERSLPDGGRRIPDEIIEASDTVRTGALFVKMCALFVPALCSYQCPLWVKSRHVQRTSRCPLSANSGHRLKELSARLLYGWCAATPGHLHLQFCGHGRAAILLEGGVELR